MRIESSCENIKFLTTSTSSLYHNGTKVSLTFAKDAKNFKFLLIFYPKRVRNENSLFCAINDVMFCVENEYGDKTHFFKEQYRFIEAERLEENEEKKKFLSLQIKKEIREVSEVFTIKELYNILNNVTGCVVHV